MQDRFKFRAKDVENGEWRYGYYAVLPFGLGSSGIRGEYGDTAHFILTCKVKQSSSYSNAEPHEVVICEEYRIDEKTLCQCTGLKDKNGKLIYEGDIISINRIRKAKVVFRTGAFFVQFSTDKYHAAGVGGYEPNELEVIGNKYETPELLEVK